MKYIGRKVKKILGKTQEKPTPAYGEEVVMGGGIRLIEYRDRFEIYRNNDCVRVSKRHSIYVHDVVNFFDFHFNAVSPVEEGNIRVVDYSKPKCHAVPGFNLFDVMFSSFAEGLSSTGQYLEFAQLTEDSIVLDLGAYAGLTSIQFDMEIAKHNSKASGHVIAVDADIQNIPVILYNIEQYRHSTSRKISYLYGACAESDGEVEFSSEGNMGASLVECVGRKRGAAHIEYVPGMTLSSIAERYGLDNVDFIKCDIEGGELYIFKDDAFFRRYSPKIIVEAHYTRDGSTLTTDSVIADLTHYGYTCTVVPQKDFILPIIECTRTSFA